MLHIRFLAVAAVFLLVLAALPFLVALVVLARVLARLPVVVEAIPERVLEARFVSGG